MASTSHLGTPSTGPRCNPGPQPTHNQPTVAVDRSEAREFLVQFYAENPQAPGSFQDRWTQVSREIETTGSYVHTEPELTFGARVAWRNSVRCIGRGRWRGLVVRDQRQVSGSDAIFASILQHVREATNGGRIRSTVSVFAPDGPAGPRVQIWNEQFFRYAGWRNGDGSVTGDPRMAEFTARVENLGWVPPERGRFTLLPLVIQTGKDRPRLFEFPAEDVAEVPISHPDYPWFTDLGLRWYALPVVSHLRLSIGGINYSAAPFNGFYVGDEIASRDLADQERYNQVPEVARRLGLDTTSNRSMWRERALVELNRAVLHSFDTAGYSISDHHAEAQRFMTFVAEEEQAGRCVRADWTWLNSHLAPPQTPTFFHYFDTTQVNPNLWLDQETKARALGALDSWAQA